MSQKPDKVVDFKDFGLHPAKGLSTCLYIGSKLHAKSHGILKEHGIRYILNVTPTRNLDPEAGCPNFFESKDPSLTYKRIAIFDNRGEEILQYMDQAISFIEQGKHYGSVLVHCNKGVSRSASFVLGYLMKTGGLRLDDALALLKSKRSIVQPNDSFMTQLRTYDGQLEKARQELAEKDRQHGTGSSSSGASGGGSGGAKKAPGVAGPPAPRAAAIGPSLPPHLVQPSPSPSKAPIGPSPTPPPKVVGPQKPPPSAAVKIGPSLPPPQQGGGATVIGPSGPPAAATKRPIGPSMPPPSGQQPPQQEGQDGDEPRESKRPKGESTA